MNTDKNEKISQYIIDTLAKMILPEIQKFAETDEGKAFFDKHKSENNKDKH